jgi:glucose-1-phosphate cytidylyltransferase
VILCGGRGTRLRVQSTAGEDGGAAGGAGGQEIPKPLVEIGGLPIVWHVIQLYAAQGFERFLLATGYKGESIERFARDTVWPRGVGVECVDTGLDTPTGGRIKLLQERLAGAPFCATYADGLASLDLGELLAFHANHGRLATMTVVRPELQFGVTELDGDDGRVLGFREKPRSEHWINGGFFCFQPGVFDYLQNNSVLERDPLERLAGDDELRAHRHEGFWECMDTYKDAIALNDLWESGVSPWRKWD